MTHLHWQPILDVWRSGQVGLPSVVRWSKYVAEDPALARQQDSLQHTYSLTILGMVICHKLRPYLTGLRGSLIQRALLVHDHGEGELGYDVHYIDKTEAGDLDEYQAFVKRYAVLPPALFEQFHEAFLVQFALKKPATFPESAQVVMAKLAKTRRKECLVFDAIERFDYVFYAWEQQQHLGNEKILVQILRNQLPHLDRLAQDLPGFGQEVWTPELRMYFQQFLTVHEGEWVERRG